MSRNDSFPLKDVLIFSGSVFLDESFVLVQNGTIAQVVSTTSLPFVCSDITVLSKPGFTLLPGLIDTHVHRLFGNPLCMEQSLRFGVMTVCDMHNEGEHIAKLKEVGGRICACLTGVGQ